MFCFLSLSLFLMLVHVHSYSSFLYFLFSLFLLRALILLLIFVLVSYLTSTFFYYFSTSILFSCLLYSSTNSFDCSISVTLVSSLYQLSNFFIFNYNKISGSSSTTILKTNFISLPYVLAPGIVTSCFTPLTPHFQGFSRTA